MPLEGLFNGSVGIVFSMIFKRMKKMWGSYSIYFSVIKNSVGFK